jgi:FKBP-type peptidyl-prolyl cis-trans isomerase FklB
MNRRIHVLTLAITALLLGCVANPPTENKAPVLSSDMQKSSYAQGVQYIQLLQQSEIPLDTELFLFGVNDVLAKKPLRLNSEQLQRGRDWVYVQQMLYLDRTSKKNLADGEAFLNQNKTKDGIVNLSSGVQYKVLADSGKAYKPTLNDTVALRYRIRKLNGEEVFATDSKSKLEAIKVATVLNGWQEALLLMPESSKWQLYVPGPLAYGENVAPESKIKPNELMIIDVELVDINPPISAVNNSSTKPIIKKTSSW